MNEHPWNRPPKVVGNGTCPFKGEGYDEEQDKCTTTCMLWNRTDKQCAIQTIATALRNLDASIANIAGRRR